MTELILPTLLHKQAIEIVSDFISKQELIDTVLLTNSCARGKAVPQSDIDFAILVRQGTRTGEITKLEKVWQQFLNSAPILLQFKSSHTHSQIHLDFINGIYEPATWDDGGGPDFFEVEIGNHLRYSKPLAGSGDHFLELCKKWLPYYDDSLRQERLAMVKNSCSYDLDQVPFLLQRKLFFHAFDKVYKAYQEFLQALFIRNRKYPIAYNKWIKDQFYEILGLPEVYHQLTGIFSLHDIESDELSAKAAIIRKLLEEYC
jgi:predicted nucleotidyltransferase